MTVISLGLVSEPHAGSLSDWTYVLVESLNLLAWGGVMEELVGWWREGLDGLYVEEPREVPNDDPRAF